MKSSSNPSSTMISDLHQPLKIRWVMLSNSNAALAAPLIQRLLKKGFGVIACHAPCKKPPQLPSHPLLRFLPCNFKESADCRRLKSTLLESTGGHLWGLVIHSDTLYPTSTSWIQEENPIQSRLILPHVLPYLKTSPSRIVNITPPKTTFPKQ